MKIRFITENESPGKYIGMISRALFYYMQKQLEPLGIQKQQFTILAELYLNEGICQDDLVSRLRLSKPDVAKSVKKLVENGFLTKEKDENDRRIHRLYVTEKALSIKPDIIGVLEGTNTILSDGIEKEELETTLKVLRIMAKNMYEASEDLKNN